MRKVQMVRAVFVNVLVVFVSVVLVLLVAEFSVSHLVPIRDVGPAFSQHHPDYGKHLKPNFQARRQSAETKLSQHR